MIYILLIACLALIGFNTYLQLKKRQQPPKETEPEQPALVPAATVIKQLLQQFNCNYKIRETHDEEEIIEKEVILELLKCNREQIINDSLKLIDNWWELINA